MLPFLATVKILVLLKTIANSPDPFLALAIQSAENLAHYKLMFALGYLTAQNYTVHIFVVVLNGYNQFIALFAQSNYALG